MNIQNEYYFNAFEMFGFWKDETKLNYEGHISSLSLEATSMLNDDSILFEKTKSKWCYNILNSIEREGYKFYLLAYVVNSAPISRIQEYKKLWGQFKSNESLDFFKKGETMKIENNSGVIFCGAAEFNIEQTENLIKIISEVPFMRTIVASKNNLLDINIVSELFNNIMENNLQSKLNIEAYDIDFDALCKFMCPKGDFVFKIGTSCEEEAFSIFYDKKNQVCLEKFISTRL